MPENWRNKTPEQQAKTLLAQMSARDAENFAVDHISNARRNDQAKYWDRVLACLHLLSSEQREVK